MQQSAIVHTVSKVWLGRHDIVYTDIQEATELIDTKQEAISNNSWSHHIVFDTVSAVNAVASHGLVLLLVKAITLSYPREAESPLVALWP